MLEILAPLTPEYSLQIPDDSRALIGWMFWFIGIILIGIWINDRKFKLDRPTLLWLAALSVLILVLTPFLGVLPRTSLDLGIGEVPIRHLMFFAAAPYMLAAGVLGVLPAMTLASISGLLLAYLDTHNIFTPLVLMNFAVVFGWGMQQRFRTTAFKLLRFPVVAAVFSLFVTAPLVLVSLVLSAPGPTAARIGLAMVRFPIVFFSLGGMVLMGSVVCVIVQAFEPSSWANKAPLRPAPGEINIKNRLLAYGFPISIIVLLGVFISSWHAAQIHARKVMVRQMIGASNLAVESLGIFLEIGEHVVRDLVLDLQDGSGSDENQNQLTDLNLQTLPYFDQIALFDSSENLIAGHQPSLGLDSISFYDFAELLDAAIADESPLIFLTSVGDDVHGAVVIFVEEVGEWPREQLLVLWGETLIEDNLYAQSFIRATDELLEQGGQWQMVAGDGEILIAAGGDGDNERIIHTTFATPSYYQSKTPEGLTQVHYFQPIDGTDWGITVTLPAYAFQELAWQITYPLLWITTGAMILIFLTAWITISPVVYEMSTMNDAINAVVAGHYDLDELLKRSCAKKGYFSKAFQSMVESQQHRMDQQAQLLSVSGRITGQLNAKDALHIIMAAALTRGASSARMVFFDSTAAASPDDSDHRLGLGKHTRLLAGVDNDVLDLSRGKDVTKLQGVEIIKRLPGIKEMLELDSVIILPLKWKDISLGVFWVAFTTGFTYDDDELPFLKELAQMASVSIVNAKTYADSQSSRLLLETIFDLIPDAILILDHNGRVVFENKNAPKVLGLDGGSLEGQTLAGLFEPEALAELDLDAGPKSQARSVYFKNEKAYFLITSPVRINPREVGQAMILKDLTQQRKEESLKSELVTTVSHELRSPLTLILGYAKILRLTGNLNDQQDVYIGNIIDGIEEMKALVQKLLDIGRLEGGDPLDIQPFAAEVFTQRVLESMDAHAKQKNIQISLNLPDFPLLIEADQTFLTQALKNLLENAIKFSKMGGEVSLSVLKKEDQVVFSVQDYGIGIAPLDQRKLFQKFGRVSAQNGQEQEGSGLGLAIVKSIAERHGGRVWLESQLGQGSTFYFAIPRQQMH